MKTEKILIIILVLIILYLYFNKPRRIENFTRFCGSRVGGCLKGLKEKFGYNIFNLSQNTPWNQHSYYPPKQPVFDSEYEDYSQLHNELANEVIPKEIVKIYKNGRSYNQLIFSNTIQVDPRFYKKIPYVYMKEISGYEGFFGPLLNKISPTTPVRYKPLAFATILRNVPEVNAQAKMFRTIKTKTARPIPTNFDGRQVWAGLLSPVNDQNLCGNCYAESSCSTLADRFAIMSLGQIKFNPSCSEMTICAENFTAANITQEWNNVQAYQTNDNYIRQNQGCNGATLQQAMNSLFVQGIPSVECFPPSYTNTTNPSFNYNIPGNAEGNNIFPYCYQLESMDLDTCTDGVTAMKKYRAKTTYNVASNETAIMTEIMRNGPVACGFMVFDNFLSTYDGKSIYTAVSGSSQGGHAVQIIGFGTDSTQNPPVDYWIIKNSWGVSWGDQGYFKMKRNIPECQLEQNVTGFIPDFLGMQIIDQDLVPEETDDQKQVAGFSGHIIDKNTGYYVTGINKMANNALSPENDVFTPYINENFPLPNYSTFWAMDYSPNAVPTDITPETPITYAQILSNYTGAVGPYPPLPSPTPTPIPQTIPTQNTTNPSFLSTLKKHWLSILFIFIIILLICGLVYFYFFHNESISQIPNISDPMKSLENITSLPKLSDIVQMSNDSIKGLESKFNVDLLPSTEIKVPDVVSDVVNGVNTTNTYPVSSYTLPPINF